jgi:hypothetical protein
MAIKRKVARKAVKTTAKHTAHGMLSRLTREPARAASLIGLGVLAGLLVGWLAARRGGSGEERPAPADPLESIPTPTVPPTAGVTGGPS